MKLDEAIEEGTSLSKVGLNRLTPNELAFVKLGIEALERLQWLRSRQVIFCDVLLDGETSGEKGEAESART